MIKKLYTISMLLIAFSVSNLQSQERYLDQMFGVVPQFDVHYASGASQFQYHQAVSIHHIIKYQE